MKKYRSRKAGIKIAATYDALLSQWQTDMKQISIPSRYGVTHVITAGDDNAPPLVLFHGVGDDAALMWVYNAKALAEHFRIFAIDTIGGPGKSEGNDGYNRSFDDVTWIDETLDGLGLKQAYFAGVSHGGYLVQLYTLKRSERVLGAIAISSSVPGVQKGSPPKRVMKIFLPEALFPTRKNTERLIRKLSGAHPDVFLKNDVLMEHYQWLLKGFNNMCMRYHEVRYFSAEEIHAIRERIVYLVGDEDPFQKLGGRDALRTNQIRIGLHAHFHRKSVNKEKALDERIFAV